MRIARVLLAAVALAMAVAGCQHDQPPPPKHAAPPSVAPLEPPKPPPGPLTAFGDGKYEIGTGPQNIAPGKYRTAGPSVDGQKPVADKTCYWARLKDFTGAVTAVNAFQYGNHGPDVVTIDPADRGFESRGCGTWVRQP